MVSDSNSEFRNKHPVAQRWAARAGIHVAGDQQLAIIDRFGQFNGFKGPGQFTIYRLIGQTIRGYISLAPIYITETISNVHSKDGLLVEVKVTLAHVLDPRPLAKDKAINVMGWTEDFRKKFIVDQAQRALQAVIPKYPSHQIATHQVAAHPLLAQIEPEFREELTQLISAMGLSLVLCQVREMNVPDLLRNRLEQIAQRTATIQHLREHNPAEYDRALRVETVEALPSMSIGKMFVNPSDLMPKADQDDAKQAPQISPQRSPPQLPKAGDSTGDNNPIEGEVLSDDEPPSRL